MARTAGCTAATIYARCMQVIVKAVPVRGSMVAYLKKHLPEAVFCMDQKGCAWDTFLRSLDMAGDGPALHMEEDVILTRGFMDKVRAAVSQRPNTLVQFFSMRKKDLEVGSRWDRSYLMNQCFYAPAGYSAAMLEYSSEWGKQWLAEHPNGTDLMVRHWLQSRKEAYWIHCPSLVDHRVAKSIINPRRSSKRQSFTFKDPQE